MIIRKLFFFILISNCFILNLYGQTNILTYAGGSGKETFYDVLQLSDGTFLVCGYADDLSWTGSATFVELSYSALIPNALGSNRFGFILHLSSDMQSVLQVVHFPQGAVEDIRFIKTNSQPYTPTGDLYISCNTADVDANNGGYVIAKLNHNFLNGIPDSLEWVQVVWALTGPKQYHPWDVTSDGRVYYISGEAHGYNWSAVYCLNQNGQRMVVPNWRTHWLKDWTEWKGFPASANPYGTVDSVRYSGIVLKLTGRCDLRSWNQTDFNTVQTDGNGGFKKGKWPADFLFNSPCDPQSPTANSPGYNGYSPEACCPVWGGSNVCIDRRNNHVYIGMNFKSYYNPGSTPDFEPAVISFDNSGQLLWWSRLYHEITPAGDTVGSIPDQYIDALAIDYAHDKLVVGARTHGNNIENFWEGNTVYSNPSAYGFQNNFTGNNGNIHESWLGKLNLSDGSLSNCTYMAELAEGTGSLGTPHADPNLDGWPDPNTGWPDVNTTRMANNNLKVSSNGDVIVIAQGRRTITTANAYQKMVKPYYGGASAWNSFVRVYESDFHVPKYSSLVVGTWDTITQAGGGNTELFGVYKTSTGVVAVGRQTADAGGNPAGNPIPISNIPMWGSQLPQNESAILAYYTASNLYNANDSVLITGTTQNHELFSPSVLLYPNPGKGLYKVHLPMGMDAGQKFKYVINDLSGQIMKQGTFVPDQPIEISLAEGCYLIEISNGTFKAISKFILTQ